MEKLKDGWYCAQCNVEMKLRIIPKYEYLEGCPLSNVDGYQCPKCDNVFFTEEQAKQMKARTKELLERSFGFERKLTVSGKSLVVGIPSELAKHLKLKKGQRLRITPVADDGFLIRKA